MNEEFKRLKQHLNFLNEKYKGKIEIMYIGMFYENKYPITIALYLPNINYIFDTYKVLGSDIALVDNFNIKLNNINTDSFEIKLIDIRNLIKYNKTSDIQKLFKSPYRIINKEYKSEILNIKIHNNAFIDTYINKLVVHRYIADRLNLVPKWIDMKPNITNLDEYIKRYDNIYVTSDLHFCHKNILIYEENRLKFLGIEKDVFYANICGKYKQQYLDEIIIKHDKKLIENYNQIIGKNDLCFIVGDFSLGKAKETENILKQLNGDKILLRGNHDSFLKDNSFNKDLFLGIYDYLEVKLVGQGVVLSHYPLLHFKKQDYERGNMHLYGHTHTAEIYKPYHSFHVGVDTNQYKPMSIQYAIEQARLEETNKPRYINKEVEK